MKSLTFLIRFVAITDITVANSSKYYFYRCDMINIFIVKSNVICLIYNQYVTSSKIIF